MSAGGGFPTRTVVHTEDELVDFQHTALDQDGAVVSLAGAVGHILRFQKPDGSTQDVTTSLLTDGTDGVHRWQSSPAFFASQPGAWKRQARVEPAAGGVYWGDKVVFDVEAPLPTPAP